MKQKITAALLQNYVDCHYTPAMVAAETGGDISNIAKRMKRLKPKALPNSITPHNTRGYVVTCAQNATTVHSKFLRTLEAYCQSHKYQLIVIPVRYRNPTTPREGEAGKDERWSRLVEPYLCSEDIELCKGLYLMGSVPIQPTAVRPLSGLDTITGNSCGIFGHTKVSLDTVATQQGKLPKLLYTTGAVTKPNYSRSKAGRKGEFHHTMGAVVVQRDGDLFHLRNLHAQSDGSFYDLECKYSGDTVTGGHRLSVLTPGDVHGRERSIPAMKAIARVCKRLKPRRIVGHNVHDHGSGSHHNTFFDRFRLHHQGRDCIYDEVTETCATLDELASHTDELIVVSSNHHDHFTKWLESDRNANDLVNAWIYAETRAYYLRQLMDKKDPMSPLEFWARRMCSEPSSIRFLGRDESFSISGVEHCYHGDKGPNGARGSTMNLSRIGTKVTKGHSHTPGIVDGCYDAATSSRLDLEYASGSPSSWLNSMVAQYQNGKRTHIHVINGRCGL